MPSASEVKPQKWTDLRVLFDNGSYSIVSGVYEGRRALGQRWNGRSGSLGFPSQAGHPVWHVVPNFLVIPVLHGLLDELARTRQTGAREYAAEILRELDDARLGN